MISHKLGYFTSRNLVRGDVVFLFGQLIGVFGMFPDKTALFFARSYLLQKHWERRFWNQQLH